MVSKTFGFSVYDQVIQNDVLRLDGTHVKPSNRFNRLRVKFTRNGLYAVYYDDAYKTAVFS